MITGKSYDLLKFLVQSLLPILGTLYFVFAPILSLPNAEEVVGTIIVIDANLGVLLYWSQAKYNTEIARGGILMVTETNEGETFSLVLADDPEVLKTKREVRFDIRKE
jgi:hypothetical protein